MSRNSLAGGDRLARGARSVTFKAGDAKKGDKIQINQGTLATDATRQELDRIAKEDAKKIGPAKAAPVMKRTPRPLYDRVVVRTKKAEERISTIIIPEGQQEKERPREGTVVFIGNGKVDVNGIQRPMVVKPGDVVLFGQYAGTDVEIDGEIVLMMREEEILAVLEVPSV
jgi:chaperonin GroES